MTHAIFKPAIINFAFRRDKISITLIQGDRNSTINIIVHYRGKNLAAPILVNSPAGNHGYHMVHSITQHVLVIMTDDDITYVEGYYGGVPIIDGNFTIEDSDHPSYVTITVYVNCVVILWS